MDDEDMRELAALQEVPQPFAAHMRQRRMAACPHCHEGFGSASLHIHMRRCRALYPSTGDDPDTAEQAPKPPKRKEVPSLADLCLRFVTKHFESICIEKIVAFPEAEAALIASMPSNLVHRMVVQLVKESKRVKTQNRECRAGVEKLERALLASQRNVAQLESVREAEATIRARLSLQQHAAQRLERELDAAKAALAVAESENRKLRVQVDRNEPHQLRLEAKINSLNAEKDALRASAKAAQKREMEATRQLALARKRPVNNAPSGRRKANTSAVGGRAASSAVGTRASADEGRRSCELAPNGIALRRSPDAVNSTGTKRLVLHKRPRSDGSKIPFPATMRSGNQAEG